MKAFGEADKVNYIITTCRRAAFSYLRKKRRADYVVDESLDIVDDEADTPELWVLTKERMEYTHRAWKLLDEKSQMILSWKYQLEMSDSEIASELNIKPDIVRMRLTRARNNFKRKLQELEMI